MTKRGPRWLSLAAALLLSLQAIHWSTAQITESRTLSASLDRTARLEEQLVNRLRAFDQEKRSYVQMVVKRVREQELDTKLVIAVEQYAIRRNAEFPFPYFERALRYQAGKQGVELPTLRQYVSTQESRR